MWKSTNVFGTKNDVDFDIVKAVYHADICKWIVYIVYFFMLKLDEVLKNAQKNQTEPEKYQQILYEIGLYIEKTIDT